jgi:hypothetical protein
MGKDQVACVDLDKGTLLWNTDKFQNLSEDNIVYIAEMEAFALSLKEAMVMITAKTGEELWQTTKFKGVVGQYIYNRDDMSAVMVNFVPGGLAALFTGFKNQIMRINLTNGNILVGSHIHWSRREKSNKPRISFMIWIRKVAKCISAFEWYAGI